MTEAELKIAMWRGELRKEDGSKVRSLIEAKQLFGNAVQKEEKPKKRAAKKATKKVAKKK